MPGGPRSKRFGNNELNNPSHVGVGAEAATVGTQIVIERKIVHNIAKLKLTIGRPGRKAVRGAPYDRVGAPVTEVSAEGNDSFGLP